MISFLAGTFVNVSFVLLGFWDLQIALIIAIGIPLMFSLSRWYLEKVAKK